MHAHVSTASIQPRAGGDLFRVTNDPLTGLRTEWWRCGAAASERERALRACHGHGGVTRATGSQQHAAWFGPAGERVETGAVTLRYQPRGDEPALVSLARTVRAGDDEPAAQTVVSTFDPQVAAAAAMVWLCLNWRAA
jgi:hypothetical protein